MSASEPQSRAALIGDLVASRSAASRAQIHESLVSALERANRLVPAAQRLEPTIGDEFQAVYATVATAVTAGLVVRLCLPPEADARVGIGAGGYEVVGASDYGLIQDGPAWWNARAAIEELKQRERRQPGLRTWVHEGGVMNAYAMTRDHLVSRFDARQRRLLLGRIEGRSQVDLAEAEQISPSAVSQSLRRSGATAVLEGLALLDSGLGSGLGSGFDGEVE